ncbi:TPA: hypothetical protein ACF35N_004493 [Vibrio parahaemolyticus]
MFSFENNAAFTFCLCLLANEIGLPQLSFLIGLVIGLIEYRKLKDLRTFKLWGLGVFVGAIFILP